MCTEGQGEDLRTRGEKEMDCYSYELTESLIKAHQRLLSLDMRKFQIRQKLDKAEENMCRLDWKLLQSEMRAALVQQESMFRLMHDQLWRQIEELERRKKAAEKKLRTCRKKMSRKLAALKKVTLPIGRCGFLRKSRKRSKM